MKTKLKKFTKTYLSTGDMQKSLDEAGMIVQELKIVLDVDPNTGAEIWMKLGENKKMKRLF